MKKIVCFLLLCCFAFTTFAQPRVNGTKSYSVVESSGILSNPVGWKYNDLDKWCGWYNVIDGEYENNSTVPKQVPVTTQSHFDNAGILSLQFKKIKSHGNIYYALYHTYYSGYYDYPAIYEGWNVRECCAIYIFTPEEYSKLTNLREGITSVKVYKSIYPSRRYNYKTKDGQEELERGLKETFVKPITTKMLRSSYLHPTIWYVKKESDGSIRFQVPTHHELWSPEAEAKERKKPFGNNEMSLEIAKRDYVDFNTAYFETSALNFKKLIFPGKVVLNEGEPLEAEEPVAETTTDTSMATTGTMIFDSVEQDPQFPGGMGALLGWISTHLRYPQAAVQNGTQGRVIIQFVVKSNGTIGDVRIVRGINSELNNEAIRLVKSLPKFIPGRMNGQAVDCWYTLPIVFKAPII